MPELPYRVCNTTLGMDGEFLVRSKQRLRIHPRNCLDPNSPTHIIGHDGHPTTWEMRLGPSSNVLNLVESIGRNILAVIQFFPKAHIIETASMEECLGSHIWIDSPVSLEMRSVVALFVGAIGSLSAPVYEVIARRNGGTTSGGAYGALTDWRADRESPGGDWMMQEYRALPSFWRTPKVTISLFNVVSDIVTYCSISRKSDSVDITASKKDREIVESLIKSSSLPSIHSRDKVMAKILEAEKSPLKINTLLEHLNRDVVNVINTNLWEDVNILMESVQGKEETTVDIKSWISFMENRTQYIKSEKTIPLKNGREYMTHRINGGLPFTMTKKCSAIMDGETVIAVPVDFDALSTTEEMDSESDDVLDE